MGPPVAVSLTEVIVPVAALLWKPLPEVSYQTFELASQLSYV